MKNIYKIVFLFIIFILFLQSGCKDFGATWTIPTPPPTYISIDDAPAWDPQGDRIAFFHMGFNDTLYPTGLYTLDTSGQNLKLIIEGFTYSPCWSPNGEILAFTNDELYLISSTGNDLQQLTTVGLTNFPSWSPSGDKIVFDTPYHDPRGSNAIWMINIDGTGLQDISQHGTGEWRCPDWSPDGNWILYYKYIGIGTPELFKMDTSGNNSTRLTYNNYFDLFPEWSPDGKRIAWTSGKNIDEIWLMDSDSRNQMKITTGNQPSWSPDSKRLVFSKESGNKISLFIIELESGKIYQLTY